MKVALLGGSGRMGRGLASRLSAHEIVIGSRETTQGDSYEAAARWCELAILTVPYAAHHTVLESIRPVMDEKVLIDATVPMERLNASPSSTYALSAAEESAAALPTVRVFAAFQTIPYLSLRNPEFHGDVLLAGGDIEREKAIEIVRSMSLRPVFAGPLNVVGAIERLAWLLISINKSNRVRESSIRIEGVPAL